MFFLTKKRALYGLLVLFRLYFAFQPSYIHPDEHFQGPEVLAGDLFKWETIKTWDFSSDKPIRGILPLWIFYAIPLLSTHLSRAYLNPTSIFYALRAAFFVYSFVIDLSLYFLTQDFTSVLVYASSYITWTYQTHTLSNSLEAIILPLIIVKGKQLKIMNNPVTAMMFGGLVSIGIFTRVTYPIFILPTCLELIPLFARRPLQIFIVSMSFMFISSMCIAADSYYYSSFQITPLNNLRYNTQSTNLSKHGLHPRLTHLLVNLPMLLGPGLFIRPSYIPNIISAIVILSMIPHQEVRFLQPLVSLWLAGRKPRYKLWWWLWILFNIFMATLMGSYHQAGVIPMQTHIREVSSGEVVWWKTYPPPSYILGSNNISTFHAIGYDKEALFEYTTSHNSSYLVLPTLLKDSFEGFYEVFRYKSHIGFDDLDFSDSILVGLKNIWSLRGLSLMQRLD